MNAGYPDIKIVTDRIETAIQNAVAPLTRERCWVTHYGANHIHPKHLVYWICVQTDKEKSRFEKVPRCLPACANFSSRATTRKKVVPASSLATNRRRP